MEKVAAPNGVHFHHRVGEFVQGKFEQKTCRPRPKAYDHHAGVLTRINGDKFPPDARNPRFFERGVATKILIVVQILWHLCQVNHQINAAIGQQALLVVRGGIAFVEDDFLYGEVEREGGLVDVEGHRDNGYIGD